MPYATQPDLERAFGAAELRQIAPDGQGGIDAARVAAALARAASTADGYLATRYTTPIAAPGPDLVGATADLARFLLYDDAATEEVARRRDHAIAWLRDVAAGKATTGGAATPDSAARPAPAVIAPPVAFTDARLGRMAPGPYCVPYPK